MIRKFACALAALGLAVGAVFADEVKGTFVKFADGTLTIKVKDEEKDYKIPEDLKMKVRDFKGGGEKEVVAAESLKRVNDNPKFRPTVVLTVDGDKVTGAKYEFGKGRPKKDDKKEPEKKKEEKKDDK